MPLQEINGICTPARDTVHPRSHEIQYMIFDLPIPDTTLGARLCELREWALQHPLYKVEEYWCTTREYHYDLYKQMLRSPGIEGVVIKYADGKYINGRTNLQFKHKEIKEGEMEVSTFVEGEGKWRGMVGVFCGVWNGKWIRVSKGQIDETFAAKLWQTKPQGLRIRFDYRELSKKGIPLQAICTAVTNFDK